MMQVSLMVSDHYEAAILGQALQHIAAHRAALVGEPVVKGAPAPTPTPTETPAPAPSAAQEAPATGGRVVGSIASAEAATAAPAATAPTQEAVNEAVRALVQRAGVEVATRFVQSFGISRATELPEERRAEFIQQAQSVEG